MIITYTCITITIVNVWKKKAKAAFLWFHMRNLSLAGYNCSGGASCMACSFINIANDVKNWDTRNNGYIYLKNILRAPSSEFVSSSILSWQILTAHAQPFRGARDLAFCLKIPLVSLLIWASSKGSGVTARMRRLAWTFVARIGDKYQIRLTRSL